MVEQQQRPSVAIGHVILEVTDVSRSAKFYLSLGLRPVFESPEMAILELRGGTHMMLFATTDAPKRGAVQGFDFMVDDVHPVREALDSRGVPTSTISHDQRSGHSLFELTDPDGHVITLFSDHTEGRAV